MYDEEVKLAFQLFVQKKKTKSLNLTELKLFLKAIGLQMPPESDGYLEAQYINRGNFTLEDSSQSRTLLQTPSWSDWLCRTLLRA